MSNQVPAAVLWDMDGTLIDSDPLWGRAEISLMQRAGAPWTQQDVEDFVGASLPTAAAKMRDAGLDLSVRQIIDHLITAVAAGVREHGIPWRPGARELLEALSEAGVPQALVTMSETPLSSAFIEVLGHNPFQAIVTGDTVHPHKPEPEPYLQGLRLLREATGLELPAERVIAIEDSTPGTTSAVNAGLATLGIPHTAAITGRDGLIIRETLTGMTPARLAEIIALVHATAN
ncbi:HAD family hydrolase [Pseudoglutamicibacter albus]|uniref:HAD superfamily hydrolase (TIGR01509 family) n=1 Tax=Pseudoglutamicibacter albus TaxID=98671 RepID=A0ABU1YX15_9MICC|nr:HAD family hydrolase [Pseudoglutamicibacter albus]MDR7292910.1 HAD superfamily hydrolase (TIGR01509 family) [Pseudoglutamicibacter albus]